MIEDNMLNKSGAKSTLCNAAIKWSPLLSQIFIRIWPFYFATMWYPYVTEICLSVHSNEPGIKSETSGVMWHVAPEYKI